MIPPALLLLLARADIAVADSPDVVMLLLPPPTYQRVMDKGLKDGQQALLVVAQDLHYGLARNAKGALDAADLHRLYHHPR